MSLPHLPFCHIYCISSYWHFHYHTGSVPLRSSGMSLCDTGALAFINTAILLNWVSLYGGECKQKYMYIHTCKFKILVEKHDVKTLYLMSCSSTVLTCLQLAEYLRDRSVGQQAHHWFKVNFISFNVQAQEQTSGLTTGTTGDTRGHLPSTGDIVTSCSRGGWQLVSQHPRGAGAQSCPGPGRCSQIGPNWLSRISKHSIIFFC